MIADWLAHLSTHMRLSMSATLSRLQERSTARDEARPGVANNEIPSALLQALFAAIDRRGELEPVADADGVLGVQRGFESAAKGWRHHVATLEIVYDRTAFQI